MILSRKSPSSVNADPDQARPALSGPTTGRRHRRGRLFAGLLAAAILGSLALASPALAVDPTHCTKGYNNANTAWGTCTGGGQWRVVTWCYLTGSTDSGWFSWPSGTHTQYSRALVESCDDVVIEAR